MADLATLRIKSPYGIESIMSLSLSVRPNEHIVLRLTGYCNEEAGFKPLVSRSCENDTIDLYEEGTDSKKLLFRGLMREIEMSAEGGMYRINLTVYSHSVLLDEEKKSRSFQDTEITYDAFLRAVSEETGILIHKKGSEEKIKTPAIMYKETDFEFLSRIASRLNTSVYPDVLTPNLHIGLPKGAREDIGSALGYGMNKDIERYMREKANGADLNDMDLISLTISDRKSRRVGDVLVFKGRPFGIIALSAELVRGEFIYTYTLAEESYVYREEKPTPLKGLSLEGKVIERQGETVKLHLDIDESQDKEKAHFYPYAPITGRAMYSMPIVGEKVGLYFPDGREENAFVQDCVRNNGDTCENTADPSVRYFRTEYGPELMMAPSKLHFKETKPSVPGLYLEIDDDFGIRLKSHKNINIKASGHIGINAGGAVRFSAPALVRFNQMPAQRGRNGVPALPESSFSYENDTHMFAKQIDQRGLSRTVYPPFPSAAPKGPAKGGFPVKQKAKEEKKGFNWGALLVAVVAVAVVVVAVVALGPGAGLVIAGATLAARTLTGAVVGAATAIADTALSDFANGTNSGLGTYIKKSLTGALTGAILGPELRIASIIASHLLTNNLSLIDYKSLVSGIAEIPSQLPTLKDDILELKPDFDAAMANRETNRIIADRHTAGMSFEDCLKELNIEVPTNTEASEEERKNSAKYIAAIYLLDKSGAFGMGHAALGLLKEDGSMEIMSFAADFKMAPQIVVGEPVEGWMLRGEATFDEVVRDGKKVTLSTNDNKTNEEKYTNFIWIDATDEQGQKMKAYADKLSLETPPYILYEENCNYFVQDDLSEVGLNFSDTEGDGTWDRALFAALPTQTMLPAAIFPAALAGDIRDGTIPNAVHAWAVTYGSVPNARLFGEIPEQEEEDEPDDISKSSKREAYR
jgi:hypothetical protein